MERRPPSDPDSPSVTLHSTWTGIIASFSGATLLLLLGSGMVFVNGTSWFTIGLVVAGLVLAAVVLFDQPIASEFTRHGVTRRAVFRHHRLAWDDITRLSRLRVGVLRTRRDNRGGLTAEVGRRNYPLVDRMESAIEYDDLRRLLGPERADVLALTTDRRPPDGRSPTWMYRRREWRPESAQGR